MQEMRAKITNLSFNFISFQQKGNVNQEVRREKKRKKILIIFLFCITFNFIFYYILILTLNDVLFCKKILKTYLVMN